MNNYDYKTQLLLLKYEEYDAIDSFIFIQLKELRAKKK